MIQVRDDAIEYLFSKDQIEDYLSYISIALSTCIHCLLDGDRSKFLIQIKEINEFIVPTLFTNMHIVVNNLLRNSYDNMEKLYMYIDCKNDLKIEEYSEKLKNSIQRIIASFIALLKLLYTCEKDDEYFKLIEQKYPEMLIQLHR